jgi:chromosome transmission fidelity protein 4
VVYHESSPLPDGTQKLGYTLFDAEASSVITSGSVSSISSGSQLEWAGFSSDGSLVVMDSDGMVSMLVTTPSSRDALQYSWDWSPMLDTVGLHKSADDKFWPITVQDGKLISVPLKGGNDYPDAGRRPVTAALPFRMPLARSLIEKSSALEEISVRANLALSQKKFVNEIVAVDDPDKEELDAEYDGLCAQVDKVTLKLFMNMADAGKVESALDLVDRLHLEKSFEIAITVADRLNHRNLSDRIVDKKEARFMVDDPMDDFVQDDYEPRYGEFASKEGLADEDEVMSTSSRRISPDGNSSRNLKRSIDDVSGDENEDQWDRPEKKFRGGGKAKKTLHKLANPFAKQRIESPAKPPLSPVKSPAKLALSRSSTFSAQSREKSKVSKRIL